MAGSPPPPPPAIHRPEPVSNRSNKAENYGNKAILRQKQRNIPYVKHEAGKNGHPFIIQSKKRHTNRLRSRKQAKLRAKRKAK